MAATRVEVVGERAVAVHAGGERVAATRAVVSSLDARRLLLELVDADAVPPWLAAEAGRIHVGRANVTELKVDAVLAAMPPVPGPSRASTEAFMLSANTGDLERAFASVHLGELPARPPLMLSPPPGGRLGAARPGGAVAVDLRALAPGRRPLGPGRPGAGRRPHRRAAAKALGSALEPKSSAS